jgi:hypothetical protein
MAFPTTTFVDQLDQLTRMELEQFVSLLQGYLQAQHKEDGSHSAITADSITLASPVVGAGNVTGDLIPSVNNRYALGKRDSVGANPIFAWKDLYLGDHLYLGIGSSGGVNPTVVPAWTVTLGSSTATWRPAQASFSIDFANAAGTTKLSITPGSILGVFLNSSGAINATTGYTERGRLTKIGEWLSPAFNAGDFTASAGAWTVIAGNVGTYAYTLVGKTMTIAWDINNTNVTAASALRLAIPATNTAAKTMYGSHRAGDAGAATVMAVCRVVATAGYVEMFANGAAGNWTITAGNNTSTQGQITFEIT